MATTQSSPVIIVGEVAACPCNAFEFWGFLILWSEDADVRRWTAGQARAAVAGAQVVGLDRLCPRGEILVVAPHPDDETLGCGGLIALAADAGRSVTVAILTDGAASHTGSQRAPPVQLARIRRREAREALAHLSDGKARLHLFGAPDGGLDAEADTARAWLEEMVEGRALGSVFTTWSADPHPDHTAAFHIASHVAAARGAALRAYPIWGLTLEDDEDAGPPGRCWALDITDALPRKKRAMGAHRSQTTAMIDDASDAFRLSPADLARHLKALEPVFLFDGEEPTET